MASVPVVFLACVEPGGDFADIWVVLGTLYRWVLGGDGALNCWLTVSNAS